MICGLQIENFALIKKQVITFNGGFTVLMGETGAGKSLVLKAIDFVLGGKADKILIRKDENFLKVCASFFVEENQEMINLFNNLGIEFDNNINLSRIFYSNGRSDIKLNGNVISLNDLKTLSSMLVNFSAQHDSTLLLDEKKHIKYLDLFCGNIVCPLKEKISLNLDQLSKINKLIKDIGGNDEERTRRLELISFQIDEIENASIEEGEDELLKNKLQLIASSEKILTGLKDADLSLSSGSSSALGYILSAIRVFNSIEKYDQRLQIINKRLNDMYYDLSDTYNEINNITSSFEVDKMELENLDERYELIKTIKRKYGATIEDVNNYLASIKGEKEEIENSSKLLSKLLSERESIMRELFDSSSKLSLIRRENSVKFVREMKQELVDLNMKNAIFTIDFCDYPKSVDDAQFDRDGFDNIKFLFTANIGSDEKKLSKTISGGEMSRFMLALKNVLKKESNTTFIFDEIDSGVSGETAKMIGAKIAAISKNNQVICISHLPFVCAMADNFLYIEKTVSDGQTFSSTRELVNDEIAYYLGKMASVDGLNVAKDFANELLKKSSEYKKSIN